MANICANVMCIYTYDKNEANLKKVYNILKENFTNCLSISEAVFHLRPDLSEKEIEEKLSGYETRGWIDCESDIIYNEETSSRPANVQIYYQSKWVPTIEAWNLAIELYGLKQVTLSEEPGCEVYINTDTSYIFFADRYVLDISYDGNDDYPESVEFHEYYSDLNSVLIDMEKCFHQHFTTELEIKEYIKSLADKHDEGWAIFAEFECC